MIGTTFPNIVRCASRKLHCSSKRMVMVYNNELTRVCDEHNVFQRMDTILRLTHFLSPEDFLILMNNLDDELKELMLHSENFCSSFFMGHIEWSPTIGILLSRQWLLHWVRTWMMGTGSPDPRNMFRDCFRMGITDPRTSTYGSICTQILACGQEIALLSKDAPALRQQHLLELIATAEKKEDSVRAKAIMEIIKREQHKARWKNINRTTQPPRGGNPMAI